MVPADASETDVALERGRMSRAVKIALVGLIGIGVACSLVVALSTMQDRRNSEQASKEIAERLGVDHSWSAIREYLNSSLKEGMARDQVQAVFLGIGPYRLAYSDL